MSYVIYGCKASQVTLYSAAGAPVYLVTLQKESRAGLQLVFRPEGASSQLGSGASWKNCWAHRGFRPTLQIKWGVGVNSTIATWDGAKWLAAQPINTAQVVGMILSYGLRAPCQVQPHLDNAYVFLAQPDPTKALTLCDQDGAVHVNLELNLIGSTVADIPAWS
jgi:hypothetical protein